MPTPPSFVAELLLGRFRLDLLKMPPGDPRHLDDKEEQFLVRLRAFCENEVDSGLIERDDRIPDHVIEGLKDIGAFCIRIPQEYGGLGLSDVCYHRALMIVSTVHSALSELLAAHQAIGLPQPLRLAGTDEQRKEFLPRCVREISAFALTEADIGNDPFRLHTTAVPNREDRTYTLNGVKLWTTNGVIADLIVVIANVPTSGGGMTAFIVEAGSPGVTVEHRSSFIGLRGLENGVIRLHEVVVPERNRIGDEGEGLDIALAAQNTGRLSLPAVCAAAAKWSLKIARQWAGARVQWDRPIGEHDAVAGKLAFIAATAFALEAIVEVSARQADTHLEAELAKLFTTEKAWLIADELMQLRGGRGYETADSAVARGERGVPVEQVLRDLRIGRIFDSSSEVLRVFLAQAIIDRRRSADDSSTAPASGVDGPLADHLSFAAEAAAGLAAEFAAAAEHTDDQRHLGRLVDIGAELYAMSATCVYAAALPDLGGTPHELADAFCSQARHRVSELFAQLSANTDSLDRGISSGVLSSRYEWLEQGVPDPSVDGPWIAEPGRGPDVRRIVPAIQQLPVDVTPAVEAARQQISGQAGPNRFVDTLEAGRIPKEKLRRLAGELCRLVLSDRRSFASAASRFPTAPAGDLFLAMADGEGQALRLLTDFAEALGMSEQELHAYEPSPLAQAYPAYLTQTSLYGSRSDIALALLANVEESGGYSSRVADALQSQYGFGDQAVAHFRFFGDTPQELLDQATATLAAGLSEGDDLAAAVRTARMVQAYETVFWNSLADG